MKLLLNGAAWVIISLLVILGLLLAASAIFDIKNVKTANVDAIFLAKEGMDYLEKHPDRLSAHKDFEEGWVLLGLDIEDRSNGKIYWKASFYNKNYMPYSLFVVTCNKSNDQKEPPMSILQIPEGMFSENTLNQLPENVIYPDQVGNVVISPFGKTHWAVAQGEGLVTFSPPFDKDEADLPMLRINEKVLHVESKMFVKPK